MKYFPACCSEHNKPVSQELIGLSVCLSSLQLSGHVALSVSDGRRSVSPGAAHPGDPGLQPPVRLHRQAALQAALL